MRVVAICNTKGGVGKSTLAAALAVRASNGGRRRVAVIDLDAQQTLAKWLARRAVKDAPEVFANELSPHDAVEKVRADGWDIVFLDGPPSFIELIEEAMREADLILVPLLPSVADLDSTSEAIALARESGKPILAVINRGGSQKLIDSTRAVLASAKVPTAATVMADRDSHVHGFAVGKTAAEVNGGRDAKAAAEIDALWREVAKLIGVKP